MANRDFKVRHGLNVCGNSSLGGNVAISGNLDVGGNLSLESADLSGALQVSGAASFGSLKVAGLTSLQGGLVVDTSMDVQTTLQANSISASGGLQVNGSTSLKSSLTVSGLTSLQGGLVVDTSMDVQTTLNANTISASGNLTVDGTTSLNGALTVSGTASFKGDLSISGSLQIGGAGGSGVGIATDVNLGSTLTVSGNTDLNGNLTVSGTTTLSGGVQAKSGLDVSGSVQATGHVSAGGFLHAGTTLQVSGSASIGSLKVAGMTSLQGGLVVDGESDFQQKINVNNISSSGTLFITGSENSHIELHSNTSGTPYIDFGRQVGGVAQDYGGRIILDGDTTLSICAQQLHFGAQNICLDGTVRATGDVCMQTVGYANQGFRAGLNAGAVGQYDTILVGERRGAGGTGDGYASITMSPGSFGSKIDATTSFWSVWTNKNSVAAERIKVNFGTSTETIALRPRGQDTLVAGSTSAGSQYVNVAGDLQVSGATSLGSLKVAGTTCLQAAVDINQTLAVSGAISAPGGIHAVGGNIQTTGIISGSQLRFVSSAGQRMTVSNLDSVSGRVGTLSATKFNWTSAGGQRITISSATITSLNVSTITVNQQGNIARRISGTVASTNAGYVTAFTVNGNNLASCVEVFFEGSIANVVVSCYAEIVVNHSGDISIRTHQGQYISLDIQVISDNNEDFAVLVKRNGGVAGTANLTFNVYPKGDETVTATSTNPYSGTTFTHLGVRGTKTTATGGNPHRFETDGAIVGGKTLTVSGLTSLQGGVVIDTSMDVQTTLQANTISASGNLTVQGTTVLSGSVQAKNTLSVAGSTVLSGAVQAKNGVSIGGSGTIAGVSWDKGHLRIGSAAAGIAMDPNEFYFSGQGNIGTISGNLALNPAGSITTGKVFDSTANIQTTAIISGTQLRCTSFAGTTADVAGNLQVSGTGSLGALKVAGATCAQGQAYVTGTLALRSELDFIGATGKFVDFMLVSSNASTFTANFRSMDHNSQNHHTHLTLVRGGAVQLAYNNNTKAATTNTGFYVSGTLCATQDVKVAGQLRATGAVSVNGSAHVAQGLQVGGTASINALRVAGVLSAQGGLVIDTSFDCQIAAQFNNISASGALRVDGQISSPGSIFAGQTLRAGGNLCAQGNAIINGTGTFRGGVNVSGTLSARKYSFEPYGVVPAYSNSNYGTITYNSTESAIELSSGSDTTIGMAFPAWKVNVNPGNKWQITMQIRASANTTGGGVYIRVYEYDAELPTGKIAVSHDASNSLVQEDTRRNVTSPQYENANGSTNWQTVTLEYTPTGTAVWASIVVLNWSGLGTNALYVREPQVNMILESINIGSNVQVTGHVSADGYGHFGQSLQVSGTISTTLLTAGKVRGNQVCAQQQLITNQQMITRGNLYVSGGSVLSGTVSFKNINGTTHWQGTADRRSAMWRNDGSNYLLLITGQQTAANVSWNTWRPFYVNLSNGNTEIRTKLHTNQISASQTITTSADVYAGGQLRAAGAVSVNGGGHIGGGLQVSGTGSFGALKVAGMTSVQGGIVIDGSFDCQVKLQANQISASGQVIVDQQVQADGSGLFGQTVRAGGNLCAQGNAYINQTLRVTQGTQLLGGLAVSGGIGLTSELDFNAAGNKYIDFMLVSSNGTQFTANFRSMNHQGQGFHTMIAMTRAAQVQLYYNNNRKLATTNTGVFVSGTLSATGDVKANGQVRAGGALSCNGGGHFSQGVQVCGTVSCNGLHAAGGAIQTTGLISGTQIRAGSNFSVGGTTTLSGTLNVTNGSNPNIELRSTASGVPYIDFSRAVNGAAQDFGARLILRGDDQFDISGAAVRIGQNTTIANGLQVVQGISCGGQLKAAGACSVNGGGHFGQGIQVSGSISCTGLHATGGAIQTTGDISGNNGTFAGKVKGTQVCAQAQCLVNNQLRVSQGSIFNGTCSFKTTNGWTHWQGTQQRRSVLAHNNGGNWYFLVTGQQTAANVSFNSWRPFYISLSNGHTFHRTTMNTNYISSAQDVYAAGQLRAAGAVSVGQGLRAAGGVQVQGNVSCTGVHATGGTIQTTGVISGGKLVTVCADFLKQNTNRNIYLARSTTCAVSGIYTRWRIRRGGRTADHFIYCESASNQAEFKLRTDGRVCADSTYNSGGADFAEYFEWADGNPNVSDRIGRSVVITGASGKIGIATAGQTPFGVVTGIAAYVGDSAGLRWKDKFLTDDYGRIIRTEDGTRVVNPDWNSACTYTPRSERPEWDTIGLTGKVPIRVGEPLNPNWMKLRVLTPTIEEYLVR